MHLYVHIPFCARRCSYCDFAIAVRRVVPGKAFVDAVLEEWGHWHQTSVWQSSKVVSTLYLGGGTPSLLPPPDLARLVEGLLADRPLTAEAEVTLEANPDDVTAARVRSWRQLGVNRISLGVQSFAPQVLTWMHRTHGPDDASRAVATLRDEGIRNVAIDLMFGVPLSLDRDWPRDVMEALALEPTHLSLYGLTVEPRTPLARWVGRGRVALADEKVYAGEFLTAHRMLEEAGLDHYEVSNAGRPGHHARHNTAYWRRDRYIGLGPSAHSAWDTHRQWNVREWEAYRRRVASGESPIEGEEHLDPSAVALEEIYLGLRTRDGVPRGRLEPAVLTRWERQGWAVADGDRVRLTPEGWLRLDALVGEASRG